ncbi:MAG: patatin-like phospholipase family protein [Actinomycetota bacterium]
MSATEGTDRPPRIALVLGSGGIVGGAYHAGVLKALNDTWGVDPRAVDVIVGTSAGSIAGALTAAGLHPNDLFRREIGQPLSPAGQAILARGRATGGRRPRTMSAVGVPAAPQALLSAIARPTEVAAGSVAAAFLPRGVTSTDHLAGWIDGLLGPEWPNGPHLRIAAVELASARRVVFTTAGDDDHHDDLDSRARRVATTPGTAVAASCAVPSVFAPVAIGDREYIDGGVHSADNLDLVGTDAYDLVVVSSPMSASQPLSGGLSLLAVRQLSRIQTARERRSLGPIGHVEILRPTPADLDAMGSNMLDPRRRPAVAHQAHASACTRLGRRPSPLAAGPSGDVDTTTARTTAPRSRIMAS